MPRIVTPLQTNTDFNQPAHTTILNINTIQDDLRCQTSDLFQLKELES